jgi:hypothetical protein
VVDEEDLVVLGEGSASVASRVSSRRVRAPKVRVVDEGYAVSVHHVESPSLVHLDDPDPVLPITSEVSGLLARVQLARVAVSTVRGGPFQHVSPLDCPILSHSVSNGMVVGRLALSLEHPVSRSAFARYSHRFQVFVPSFSRAPLLAMLAFSRVPRHLGDMYRDVNCEGWKSAMRAELDNFRDMEVWLKVDRPIGRNVMASST